ncbi:MAG: rhomboid family intramembrane serine protease, partial [Planctomycetota bacterium]|nr:rhomboid family intramembrane serine protease [Planctomycetota bacterium]
MIVLPWRTDVAIRHKPWATLGLLAAMLLVFAVVRLEPKTEEWLVVEYGKFNPLTWLTSLLVHTNILRLAINLFGIWTFGWIVEGLVGPRLFLAIFFATGVAEGAVEQIVMLGMDSGAGYGPGAAIYALLACAAIWVPENHITAWILIVIFPWGNQTFRVIGYV